MHKSISVRRLPLSFDAEGMARDLAAIPDDAWVTHFNTFYHDGGWSGVALRATGGEPGQLYPGHGDRTAYRGTPLLAQCPHIAALLNELDCPVGPVRLLRLSAGGVIREHRDEGLCLEQGLARLHVPISTGDGVEFYLDRDLVTMVPGECWYLNFDLPHRVQNLGTTDRVHLVIDCEANDWLRALIAGGIGSVPSVRDSSSARFARFREIVMDNPALIARLWPIEQPGAFIDRVVALGQEHGFRFTPEDVAAAMREGGRIGLRLVG